MYPALPAPSLPDRSPPLMSTTLHMRLSIPTKLFIAFCGVILTFTIVLMVGIWRSQRINTQNQALSQSIIPLSLLLSDAQNDIKSVHVLLNESNPERLAIMLERMNMVSIAPKHASSKLVRAKALSQRNAFSQLDPAEQARFAEILLRLEVLITTANALDKETQRLAQALNPGAPNTFDTAALRAQMIQDTERLDRHIARLRNDLRILSDVILLRIQRHERENLYALAAMSLIAILIALLLLGAALKIVQPLKPLTAGVKQIAHGDYAPIQEPEPRSLLGGGDELLTLTREFNHMAQALAARDETLQKQHAALLRSERLATIGRMTSLITHELRNPLSSIGLNAEMLQDFIQDIDTADRDELLAILDTITDEVDRLSDITEEYLVYARQPEPKPSHEDLLSLLEQLIDFHSWEWSSLEVGVTLHTRPEQLEQAPTLVDPNQFRQAFLNLLKNAVEASPPGKQVAVELVEEPESWVIHIRDEGKGLPAEHMEHIFEPFYTNKEQGSGLGLPMTLQIIEQHHGKLTAHNNPGDQPGACFTITLPRRTHP